jgi:phosphate transport system ATP-binding protein
MCCPTRRAASRLASSSPCHGIILFDEPSSALVPRATAWVEELVQQISGRVTVIIVTHNMQQAARVFACAAFIHLGEVVEVGPTGDMFTAPRVPRTQGYMFS